MKNVTIDYRNVTLFQHDYSKFSEQAFVNSFNKLSWDDINDVNLNVNNKFDKFYEKVHHTNIEHVPSHIQKLIEHREKLLRKLRKSHSAATEELYKKFRNRVVAENRKSKIQYYENYFQKNTANMKNLWTGIKAIINTKSKSSLQNISQLVVDDKTHTNLQDTAHIFNKFFVNVSSQVCPEIPRTKKSPLDYLKIRNVNSIFFKPIVSVEIQDIISGLDNSKSSGPYSVPVKLLKVLNPQISELLAQIFNESLSVGIFPDELKYAKVIPIHKKGSPTDTSNYRPISLLSVFSKIFEKFMHRRLYGFLDKLLPTPVWL